MAAANRCTLEDMPAELRLHIVGFLDRARDMAAALIASRLFAGRSAMAMAIQEGAVYTARLLEAGAPLDIVERTILARPRPLGRGFVESAVRGGHMDVLRFVCILVEEDMGRLDFEPLVDDQDPDTPRIVDIDFGDQDPTDCTDTYNWFAICAAARLGRIEALRYLTTRPILLRTTTHMICEDLVAVAARAGSATSVAYVHDRMFDPDSPCPCSCTGIVGRAAWAAPTPDVILWMRLHGCAGGCERADNQDLVLAISQGRTTMVRYMMSDEALDVDHDAIQGAMDVAASRGHVDTLRVVLDTDTTLRVDPVVVGAARGGRVDVLSWICNIAHKDDDSSDTHAATLQKGPAMSTVRAAALMAAANGQLTALAWLTDRYPNVVDAVLLRAAIGCGSMETVRMVDALLPTPFDWRRLVVCAIGSGSVDIVRFIVEKKGVAIDPFSIVDADLISDDMLCYLSTVCAPDEMQMAFDATLVDGHLCRTARADQMHSHNPHLCVSLASATEGGGFGLCTCTRCLSGRGPCSTMATMTPNTERPAKRRRIGRRRRSTALSPSCGASAPASPSPRA
ncbi:hypothetical protein pqer_cds_182 [Pandoravirus quercus]|uniref:Ankyrin repeat domain containing protein n=1 Tax=Pandoravirus quercus TaxID=2107709 RepID=A0A2U7U848_9VIRU|nr:hypothetical protein pqer_cds_182 [Pandoravirus quercus]AVK74604.1 hypothetical protein pqer_cds_182 [Pandoravirus quercus]